MRKRSKHNLSHYKIADYDFGYLYPVSCQEVIPGETFQASTQGLIRVSPLVTPVMHPVHVYFHHWFVPYRLIWDGFEKFITGGAYGSTPPVHPFVKAPANSPWGAWSKGGLFDHFGIVPEIANKEVNALPIRAYNLIWNNNYRDQDLNPEVAVSKGDGLDTTTFIDPIQRMLQASWTKDKFSVARPWPQKGNDVMIPFADSAPAVTTGNDLVLHDINNSVDLELRTAAGDQNVKYQAAPGFTSNGIQYKSGIEVDLDGVPGSILELREAFATERWLEARSRFGSRYTEYLRYCGVRSSDARLQLPEYLGGGKQTLQFSEVLQTGVDSGDEGVGNLRGHGIGAARSNTYRRFFEEHGLVMTLMCIRPTPVYAQAEDRFWHKRSPFDYWTKEFEQIGQQPILNKEIYGSATTNQDEEWGWENRYEEYRKSFNRVSGSFREGTNPWTFARTFAAQPPLDGTFVICAPKDSPFADTTSPQFHAMVLNKIVKRSPVSPTGGSSRVY